MLEVRDVILRDPFQRNRRVLADVAVILQFRRQEPAGYAGMDRARLRHAPQASLKPDPGPDF